MCLNVFIFMYYHFSEKTTCFVWKTMIVYTNYISILFYFFHVSIFFVYFLLFFIFFYFIISIFIFFIFFYFFLFVFIFPYFRRNFLNSRADLEFKEIRLFSTMIFSKKKWNSMFFQTILMVFSFSTMIFRKKQWISFFFEKSSWKKVEFP